MTRKRIIELLRASGKYELFEKELENHFTFELLNLLRKEKEEIKMKGVQSHARKETLGILFSHYL